MKIKNIAQRGFTLIEILVVVSIIGILAAVLLANMVGIRERAADTRAKQELGQVKAALRLYYNDHQSYPDTDGVCSTILDPSAVGGIVYITSEAIPAGCAYNNIDGDSFQAHVILQNLADPDIEKSATKCGVGSPPEGAYYICNE